MIIDKLRGYDAHISDIFVDENVICWLNLQTDLFVLRNPKIPADRQPPAEVLQSR